MAKGLRSTGTPVSSQKARVLDRLGRPADEGDPSEQVRVLPIEPTIETHPVEPRHPKVAQDGVVRAGGDLFQRLLPVPGRIDVMALQDQGLCDEHRHQRLVVNDQDSIAAGLGGGHVLGGHSTASPSPL
jgi:hypothetical protein